MLRRIDELLADRGGVRTDRLRALVNEFAAVVTNRDFPCIHSTLPFATTEIYFDLINGRAGPVEEAAVSALRELCGVIHDGRDRVGVIFVEQPGQPTLADDFDLACRIVQAVMRRARRDHPGVPLPEPDEPRWELWLDGVGLFLNFSSPRHQARRSRNVGPCFTIIAQERRSFDRAGRGAPKVRETIRQRLASYDTVGPHPSLGSFHDDDSREALQFFLGDGTRPMDPTGTFRHAPA